MGGDRKFAFISRGTGRGRESNETWTGLMNGVLVGDLDPPHPVPELPVPDFWFRRRKEQRGLR